MEDVQYNAIMIFKDKLNNIVRSSNVLSGFFVAEYELSCVHTYFYFGSAWFKFNSKNSVWTKAED